MKTVYVLPAIICILFYEFALKEIQVKDSSQEYSIRYEQPEQELNSIDEQCHDHPIIVDFSSITIEKNANEIC